MTDDDEYEVVPLPDGYDDSEPGSVPELFAKPVEHARGLGDVLLSAKQPDPPPKPPAPTLFD